VRLEPGRLVVARDGAREEAPVTTLRAAAAFVLGGPPDLEYPKDFDVPEPGDVDAPLALDPAAAAQLGAWYRFGAGVLAVMRDEAGEGAGEIQLWPEHFDIAVEVPCGVGRMMFGASPGDGTSDEPYLYVLPPGPVERSGTWNARGFAGAALPLSGFAGAADHRAAALAFLRSRRDAVP
jgi:hypothetical protein